MHDFLYGVDDGLVPRAAAIVSGNVQANFVAARFRMVSKNILSGHQHARGAEATLQRVAPMKGRLYFS